MLLEKLLFLNQSNILHVLWKPKCYCDVHNNPSFLPILNYTSRKPCPYPLSWRSILILSSHLHVSPILGLCSACICPHPVRATCLAYLILLSFITRKVIGEDRKPWRTSLCSLPQLPVTSSLLGPAIFSSTLSSKSRKLRLSVSVRDQVIGPNITIKIYVILYILIFYVFG